MSLRIYLMNYIIYFMKKIIIKQITVIKTRTDIKKRGILLLSKQNIFPSFNKYLIITENQIHVIPREKYQRKLGNNNINTYLCK